MNAKKIESLLFIFFLTWIFTSAFYYAPNLVSGDVLSNRNTNLEHKALKYVIALIISFGFLAIYKSKKAIYLYLLFSLNATLLAFFHLSDYDVTTGFDITIVAISFLGFSLIGSRLTDENTKILLHTITASCLLISPISFIEYLFFEPILGDYWENTGGFRSISTLLNPNNFGIYLGAGMIITTNIQNSKTAPKILFTTIIIDRKSVV